VEGIVRAHRVQLSVPATEHRILGMLFHELLMSDFRA
jgi:hypothetical protein